MVRGMRLTLGMMSRKEQEMQRQKEAFAAELELAKQAAEAQVAALREGLGLGGLGVVDEDVAEHIWFKEPYPAFAPARRVAGPLMAPSPRCAAEQAAIFVAYGRCRRAVVAVFGQRVRKAMSSRTVGSGPRGPPPLLAPPWLPRLARSCRPQCTAKRR